MNYDIDYKDAMKIEMCEEIDWIVRNMYQSLRQAAYEINVAPSRLSWIRNKKISHFKLERLMDIYVMLGGKVYLSTKNRFLISNSVL